MANIEKHGEVSVRLPRSTGFVLEAAFDIPSKGISVLFGPSGCGKTTILRCVSGLERAQGRVLVKDCIWQDDEQHIFLPTYERSLGYVFQEASLFEHLNVQKNLTFGIARAKTPNGMKRLADAVELLGIGHLLSRRISELSGGERQRCAIARALAMTPDIMLMDEPLAALDWARKREILPWLEKLRDELQIPILYVTHSADEMARLADHLIVLESGQIVTQGPLADVLTNIKTPFSTGEGASSILLGCVESIMTKWRLALVSVGEWMFEVPLDERMSVGATVRLRIMARDVSVALQKPKETSIRNVIDAKVLEIGDEDTRASVHLKLGNEKNALLARVTRLSVSTLALRAGMHVWVQIKSAAVIL